MLNERHQELFLTFPDFVQTWADARSLGKSYGAENRLSFRRCYVGVTDRLIHS
jgi:hypothetical protein